MSSIAQENGVLVYKSGYNAGLVAALKAAIPATDRKWDMGRKAWLVAPQHGSELVRLTKQFLGEVVTLPAISIAPAAPKTRVLDVRYIGMTKDRGDSNPTAFGLLAGGEWGAVFPETVLREWFNAEARPDEIATLYAVLGVPTSAPDDDIRSAYRRLARTWHPDVCREPDAAEQFKRIQYAYEVLHDPAKRAKYNAGMALEASLRGRHDVDPTPWSTDVGYRSPLRCGLIMAEGREVLGRFVVGKILIWSDITDAAGRVLVTSWPAGAQEPLEAWN